MPQSIEFHANVKDDDLPLIADSQRRVNVISDKCKKICDGSLVNHFFLLYTEWGKSTGTVEYLFRKAREISSSQTLHTFL